MTNNTQSSQTHGFIVLVEWDGQRPPTSWYSFLAKEGLTCNRTDKYTADRVSPLTRRASPKNSGIAFQEGAIIVNSGDTARRLAANAEYYGAKTISIGSVALTHYQMTEQDQEALDKALAVTSKRGPKSKDEEGRYVIFCVDEAATHVADLRSRPISCPECGSSRITWHRADQGKIVKDFKPAEDDICTYWLSTRFDQNGVFEVPTRTSPEAELPSLPDTNKFELHSQNLVNLTMSFVQKNAETIDGNGYEILRAMDIAYCVQQLDDQERLARRIEALREFYASGKSTPYLMAIDPLNVDMVDIASMDSHFISKL